MHPHFRKCWFIEVKSYHWSWACWHIRILKDTDWFACSIIGILIDPHFHQNTDWSAFLFSKYWSIRILSKILIDPHFQQSNTDGSVFSCRHLFSLLGNSVGSFISPGPSTNPESSRPAAKHARVFLMALASKPYICRILVVHVCWSDVLEEFAWGSYRPCIVNTGP